MVDTLKPLFSSRNIKTYGAIAKHYGIECRSVFSTEGSFQIEHTESTFTGSLVNVSSSRDLRWNSGENQGGSREYGVVGSPRFAKVRMKARVCFWYTLELA